MTILVPWRNQLFALNESDRKKILTECLNCTPRASLHNNKDPK
jgi:hypothetical protein